MIKVQMAPPEHYFWLAERTGLVTNGEFRALEALDGDEIVGMVGYDKWTHNAVRIHVVLSKNPPRELVYAALDYPFQHKGIVLGEIANSNKRSLRLAVYMGFKEICRIKDGWKVGDDLVIMELRREAWEKGKEG